MNSLSSLGSHYFLPQKMADVLNAASVLPPFSPQKYLPGLSAVNDDIVSLSDTGLALARRASDLGNTTINAAKNFLAGFAQQLFGDAANGMTISFESASLSAMADFSQIVQSSASANSKSGIESSGMSAAAMRLHESSDFVGKGVIVTADGHRYNFEVEVHYQAMVEAVEVNRSSDMFSGTRDQSPLSAAGHPDSGKRQNTEHQPAVSSSAQNLMTRFPGSINDLFALLDHHNTLKLLFDLPSGSAANGSAKQGSATLHVLDRVESAPANVKKLSALYGLASEIKDTVVLAQGSRSTLS